VDPFRSDQGCQETLRGHLLGLPGVREDTMFGLPGFFVGRKLFACIYGQFVGVRVPADLAERLLRQSRCTPFRPYRRRAMREWVQFPCASPEETADYEDVLMAAYEFVGGKVRER